MNGKQIRLITFILCIVMIVGLVGIGSGPSPAEAQIGPSCGNGLWDTTYYNDVTLTTPAYIGCTVSTQLNQGLFWGTGSPVGGVNPTNFSGRYVANITFVSAGTYRFTSTFQDGARLYINGQPTAINFWGVDIASPQTVFADYFAPAPNTTVSVTLEIVKYTGNGQVNLNWALIGGGGLTPTPAPTGTPWTAEYFNNRTWTPPMISGPSLPAGPLAVDWQFAAPVAGVQADEWSSRFTSVVYFPTGGLITFEARADDTVVVRVDGTVVTASAPFFQETTYTGSVQLTPGNHTIVVEHTDIVVQAYLFVSWTGGGVVGGGGGDAGGGGGVVSPTGVTATVTASVGLNFRTAPTTGAGRIGRLDFGQTFAVLGRNFDGTWAYLEALGTRGWSYARWLDFNGDFLSVPVLDSAGNPYQPSGEVVMFARPVGNMRVRECPGFGCGRLGFVPWGDVVGVYGQSLDRRWIKIEYVDPAGNILIGWSYKIWYRHADDLTRSLPRDLPFAE